MNEHDELFESVALLALGVLPEAEATAVAAHVRDCAQCRAEYAELRSAADALGYAAEADAALIGGADCKRLKARVMDAAATATPARRSSDTIVPLRRAPAAFASPGRTAWLAYAAAAAALIVAIVSSANYGVLKKQYLAEQNDVARASDLQARVAAMLVPGSRYYAIPQGEVVENDGRIIFALRGLPDAGPGKVYQAWTLAAGAKTMAPSVTFVPDRGGITLIELPRSAAPLAAVAVSVEPAGGSKAPTSTPTFVRKLT